jgi:hypothetical protein
VDTLTVLHTAHRLPRRVRLAAFNCALGLGFAVAAAAPLGLIEPHTNDSATRAAASAADRVVAFAGDVAGDVADERGDIATGSLIQHFDPAYVLNLGDSAYPDGTATTGPVVVGRTRLTTNAAPEPVALQRRTLSGAYTTVRTVRSNKRGHVTRLTTPPEDRCYRWVFRGTSTTRAVAARGDCVRVRR